MPVFLYVETNFPLSYATGRSRGAETILSSPSPSLRLIMPSVCFMEASSVFEAEAKRNNQRLNLLGQHLGEVNRNIISPLSPSLASQLAGAKAETELLFQEFEARLFHALDLLSSTAELIHPTPEILASSRSNVLIEDPTDNLILASILDHSNKYAPETKIFLSENRRDFDINPRARLALRGAGVRYFADASRCLEWHESRSFS